MKRYKLIYFLQNKASYSHSPKSLKHIQTHASDVFIVPPYVYKVKKPVNLRFLDFSTLEKRKFFCEREIELNRRLSNGIYLYVEKISIVNGNLVFGDGEKVVEYAVKMKKLPEKYFLKNLLKKRLVKLDDFSEIVEILVKFYKNQRTNEKILKYGKPEKIKFNIDENFDLGKKFIGKTITLLSYNTIKSYNNLFFKKNSKLFEQRINDGFIKDCHGDLHLEHINLSPKGINIFDCIEFNNRFRYIDLASDIAFLSMDLDFNNYYKFSWFVVSRASRKLKDKSIKEIMDFYKCYRAFVRGKVESIRSESEEVSEEERKASKEKAKKYFQLALRYSLFGSGPTIIVVFGMIATGKSTLASLLGKELSAVVISSDKVRKELTGKKLRQRDFKVYKKGIYKTGITKMTYSEILNRGIIELNKSNRVILDATYSKKEYRNMVIKKAKKLNSKLLFIETTATIKTIKTRLLEREKSDSISDARLEIFDDFKKNYETPSELKNNVYIKINANVDPENTLKDTVKKILKK